MKETSCSKSGQDFSFLEMTMLQNLQNKKIDQFPLGKTTFVCRLLAEIPMLS